MSEVYTRRATLAIKKESTANTPVTPDTFLEFNDESLAVDYALTPITAIAGNRSVNIGVADAKIPAPSGVINVNVEPKTFGNFLEGVFGDLTSGNYFALTSIVGTFTVGETITGGTSTETAVVASVGKDFLIVNTVSGAFTDGETVTGGSSGATGALTEYASDLYGHYGSLPATLSNTYTVQINLVDHALRYFGAYFQGLDSVGQTDNVITTGIKVMGQSAFRNARVTAVTSSGAGSKAITLDTTHGLVAGDSIKLFRPSGASGSFQDFSTTSVKTHTIDSVDSDTQITVTNLEVSTAVGDLVLLAPLTATYDTSNEFIWKGGSTAKVGADLDNLAEASLEEFSLLVDNEFEERHGVSGSAFKDRFPSALLQKGVMASGNFMLYFTDEQFADHMRRNNAQALRVESEGGVVGSNTTKYLVRFDFPEVQYESFNTSVDNNSLVEQDIPFVGIYNSTEGLLASVLLVNDVASY